jgi:hypothetical protein
MGAALSGKDTIVLNGRIMNDLADGPVAHLTFDSEIANVKTGKNGNSIYALNATGKQAKLMLRLLRGSGDDKFLNGILASQRSNFAAFVLMQGQFVKKIGDGLGNITNDTYITSGGVMGKEVEVESNVDGETGQSVAVYEIKFSNAPRVIG